MQYYSYLCLQNINSHSRSCDSDRRSIVTFILRSVQSTTSSTMASTRLFHHVLPASMRHLVYRQSTLTTREWFSSAIIDKKSDTTDATVIVSQTTATATPLNTTTAPELTSACGTVDDNDDEMEQEEMFVDPHASLGHDKREWGGPRRGGRLLEPTRFGDWERKGRCSDF